MKPKIEKQISELFKEWSGEEILQISQLPRSGSDREYIRIKGKTKSVIGTYNPDKKENNAFLNFSKHFLSEGLNVPEIYSEVPKDNIYIQEDLGNTTLFGYLSKVYVDGIFPKQLIEIYKRILTELPRFQIEGSKNLDFSVCYPRSSFDKQSMMWDLNYFKYYFLKLAKVHFDEQELENDFQTFTDYLLKADRDYFLYRDFQSRNIMLNDDKVYFIDYQGGRRGALQYDVASLLYDSKADIPQHIREELLDTYVDAVGKYIKIDREEFINYFQGYTLVRIMQAMGSYGFRGFYEKKEHFLLSIPFALKNLKYQLENLRLPIKLPALINALEQVLESDFLKQFGKNKNPLKVTISSFSYKKGFPADVSGNGGGFVFDCRCLNNPGRYPEFKKVTGKDQPVIDFFSEQTDIHEYLKRVYSIVDMAIENYSERKFGNLMINFGCTGGQHRSVFCAENLNEYLKKKYGIETDLRHTENHLFTDNK